jgi:hypothetical protein
MEGQMGRFSKDTQSNVDRDAARHGTRTPDDRGVKALNDWIQTHRELLQIAIQARLPQVDDTSGADG